MNINFFKKSFPLLIVMAVFSVFMVFVIYSILKPTERLPIYNPADVNPRLVDKSLFHVTKDHTIADFSLTNQNGKIVTQNDYKDKIYVADFFFTTCQTICPIMTDHMVKIQNEIINDDEVMLLSHSVTPETDSIATLKNYAKEKGIISKKWHLVTGNRKEIYNLGRKAYFVEEDLGKQKTDDDFLHTENFVLIDKNRHIRGIYNGLNKTAVQQLIADVKTLQLEE